MTNTEDLSNLSRQELLDALNQAQLELEDLEEERLYFLGQTGVHIGVRELGRMRAQFEQDEKRLKARIAAIESLLNQREGVR